MVTERYQFLLPTAVDERLEELVAACNQPGQNATRSEMVGLLIWGARPSARTLDQRLRSYRTAMRSVHHPDSSRRRPGRRAINREQLELTTGCETCDA